MITEEDHYLQSTEREKKIMESCPSDDEDEEKLLEEVNSINDGKSDEQQNIPHMLSQSLRDIVNNNSN